MPASSPSELISQLELDDPELQLRAVREIKNGIIGNKRRKVALASAGAINRLVEILRKAGGICVAPMPAAGASDVRAEIMVHLVGALGSFAFGSTDSTERMISAGAFPLLRQLLFAGNRKIVAAAARTMKIMIECKSNEGDHIFASAQCVGLSSSGEGEGLVGDSSGEAERLVGDGRDLTAVERLLELVAEGQEGITDVAASVLARSCRTRDHQLVLSRAGAWKVIDGLLASTPKGQEAGLDLAASMVRGSAEEGTCMLGRSRTDLATLLGFVQHHRRPFIRLLACAALAGTVESGALPLDKNYHEISVVLQTVISLLSSEPHKGIKEAAPNIIALLIRNNKWLQSAACDAGATRLLVSQGEIKGASVREKVAVINCLECMAEENEEYRTQVGFAGGMRLVGACVRDAACPDALLLSALSLLLALSRSVRNLRTCIGDEQDLGEHLCMILRSGRSLCIKARLCASLCNLVMTFSPMRSQLISHGLPETLLPFVFEFSPSDLGSGDAAEGAHGEVGQGATKGLREQDVVRSEMKLNAIWALRNLSYEADSSLTRRLLYLLEVDRLLQLIDPARIASTTGGWNGEEAELAGHALGLTRNLCHGTQGGAHIVLERVGGSSVPMLLAALAGCMADKVPRAFVSDAVGVISNMAANCSTLRLAIGMDARMMRQIHGTLMSGERGAGVLSEIGWCLVNLSFPARQRVESESAWEHVNLFAASRTGRQLPCFPRSNHTHGDNATSMPQIHETTARCDQDDPAKRQELSGPIDSEAQAQQHGDAQLGQRKQVSSSGDTDDATDNSRVFAHMKALGMIEAVGKILEQRKRLDSSLCRKLEQLQQVLKGERSAGEVVEDESAEEDEEEVHEDLLVAEEDEGGEGEEEFAPGDWVMMVPHLQANAEEAAMQVDESEESATLSPAHGQRERERAQRRNAQIVRRMRMEEASGEWQERERERAQRRTAQIVSRMRMEEASGEWQVVITEHVGRRARAAAADAAGPQEGHQVLPWPPDRQMVSRRGLTHVDAQP